MQKITLSQVAVAVRRLASHDNLDKLKAFFMGEWYPIWVAASVLIGRVTGLELYFAMADFVIVSVALLLCDSVRPVLPNLISFLYRISLEHGPGIPSYSTYYTGPKMIVFSAFAALFFATLIYFFVKNRLLTGFSVKSTPLFIPLSALSASFLLGGAFSGKWSFKDFTFALLEVFVFFVVFLILYFGLRRERAEELCNYFVYICAVTAVILILEVVNLFLSVDGIITDGAIRKDLVYFGWGISNTAGSALSVLIPICFLGMIRSRSKLSSLAYFMIANLTLIASAMTLSRNAVLVGSVFYLVCMIISCFVGEQKKLCRIATLCLLGISLAVALIFKEQIGVIFTDFSNKGFSDNGRYRLWSRAWDDFKSAPIFGIGYFSYAVDSYATSTFTPRLAHNTVLQLLASMGIFGFASYITYRVYTFIPFFKKPTKEKAMLLLSIGVLLGESLLDNFIFWFAPTFIYNIAIVIAFMYCEEQKKKSGLIDTTEPIITL